MGGAARAFAFGGPRVGLCGCAGPLVAVAWSRGCAGALVAVVGVPAGIHGRAV